VVCDQMEGSRCRCLSYGQLTSDLITRLSGSLNANGPPKSSEVGLYSGDEDHRVKHQAALAMGDSSKAERSGDSWRTSF
jgi:hypothetical protein